MTSWIFLHNVLILPDDICIWPLFYWCCNFTFSFPHVGNTQLAHWYFEIEAELLKQQREQQEELQYLCCLFSDMSYLRQSWRWIIVQLSCIRWGQVKNRTFFFEDQRAIFYSLIHHGISYFSSFPSFFDISSSCFRTSCNWQWDELEIISTTKIFFLEISKPSLLCCEKQSSVW